jgi:hypothetical protein
MIKSIYKCMHPWSTYAFLLSWMAEGRKRHGQMYPCAKERKAAPDNISERRLTKLHQAAAPLPWQETITRNTEHEKFLVASLPDNPWPLFFESPRPERARCNEHAQTRTQPVRCDRLACHNARRKSPATANEPCNADHDLYVYIYICVYIMYIHMYIHIDINVSNIN